MSADRIKRSVGKVDTKDSCHEDKNKAAERKKLRKKKQLEMKEIEVILISDFGEELGMFDNTKKGAIDTARVTKSSSIAFTG